MTELDHATATNAARAARYRNVEKLQPGYWWLGTYGADEDTAEQLWAQASMILELEQLTTGRRIVRVIGTATDGEPVELVQYRGYSVESLTERQGDKLGLVAELNDQAEDEPEAAES
jgi:hypothetical protein